MEEGIDAADRALDQRWPGFAPRATVTLRATLIDGLGQRWTSAVPTRPTKKGAWRSTPPSTASPTP